MRERKTFPWGCNGCMDLSNAFPSLDETSTFSPAKLIESCSQAAPSPTETLITTLNSTFDGEQPQTARHLSKHHNGICAICHHKSHNSRQRWTLLMADAGNDPVSPSCVGVQCVCMPVVNVLECPLSGKNAVSSEHVCVGGRGGLNLFCRRWLI